MKPGKRDCTGSPPRLWHPWTVLALRPVAVALAAGAAAAGCGQTSQEPISFACTNSRAALARALAHAPAPVRLRDGTSLSQCVSHARDEGSLQDFGVLATQLADQLSERATRDPHAALELGYLVGAARRGAADQGGVMAELVHRIEAAARRLVADGPGALSSYDRGVGAGERHG